MKKALVVGIDNYPRAPLSSCINDATRVASLLEANADGTKNFDVKLETDLFTRSVLRGKLAALFSGSCEMALFYFSGHGYVNEFGGYLATPDGKPYDEGVPMDEILRLANNSAAGNKLIILDSCHSGTMGTPAILSAGPALLQEGVTILAASRHNESAAAYKGSSVFTELLAEALNGGAADINGRITPGGIYAFIDQALGPFDQRPVFKTNISRVPPIRTVNPLVPVEILRKLVDYFRDQDTVLPLNPSYEHSNSPELKTVIGEPYAVDANVAVFKHLQQFRHAGLVVPVNTPYMYYAAIDSGACRLTPLGRHYWRLVKNRRI
jgi:hypothetical protein